MTIFPRGNRVLIKRDAAEGISKGGIILPDAVQDKQQRGTVLAVDPEYQAAADQGQPGRSTSATPCCSRGSRGRVSSRIQGTTCCWSRMRTS